MSSKAHYWSCPNTRYRTGSQWTWKNPPCYKTKWRLHLPNWVMLTIQQIPRWKLKRFWLSHQLFQTYGVGIVTSVKHLDAFLFHFHPCLNCTSATTSELIMSLSSSLMLRSTAHFPLHSFHFPGQALPRKRTSEYSLNEWGWITESVNKALPVQLFHGLKLIWKILLQHALPSFSTNGPQKPTLCQALGNFC